MKAISNLRKEKKAPGGNLKWKKKTGGKKKPAKRPSQKIMKIGRLARPVWEKHRRQEGQRESGCGRVTTPLSVKIFGGKIESAPEQAKEVTTGLASHAERWRGGKPKRGVGDGTAHAGSGEQL